MDRRCSPRTAIRGERPEIQFSSRKPRANKDLAHRGKSFMVAPNDLAFQANGLGARSGFAICPVLTMDEGIKWRGFGHIVSPLLLPVLFVAVIGLWFKDIQTPHDSPGLVIALNLLLATLPALVIAYLFARSFLVTGVPGMALFGCGALIWSVSGLSPLAASLAPGHWFNVNTFVTIHMSPSGARLCAISRAPPCSSNRTAPCRTPGARWPAPMRWPWLWRRFIVFMALKNWTPVFIAQGKGGSAESQFVLGSAVFTILLTLSLLRGRPPKAHRVPRLVCPCAVPVCHRLYRPDAAIRLWRRLEPGEPRGPVSRWRLYAGRGLCHISPDARLRSGILAAIARQPAAPLWHRHCPRSRRNRPASGIHGGTWDTRCLYHVLSRRDAGRVLWRPARRNARNTSLGSTRGYFWMEPARSFIPARSRELASLWPSS